LLVRLTSIGKAGIHPYSDMDGFNLRMCPGSTSRLDLLTVNSE
jgi:hypothetical protein